MFSWLWFFYSNFLSSRLLDLHLFDSNFLFLPKHLIPLRLHGFDTRAVQRVVNRLPPFIDAPVGSVIPLMLQEISYIIYRNDARLIC